MKKLFLLIVLILSLALSQSTQAQCSICTKTAQQMGHKPAKGLNSGIIYLMIAPLAIMGFVGFRWWRNNGQQ
jgi:hypothetical protein